MDVLDSSVSRIEYAEYADIREAFFNKDLSRTFDRRSFEEGNIRQGVVSTAHGDLHRARRRLENAQFRAEILRMLESEFPAIVQGMLDTVAEQRFADLFRVGNRVSMVLAAQSLGVDLELRSPDRLALFESQVEGLALMSEILDAKDPDRTREIARRSLADWGRDFVQPSAERRSRLIDSYGPDSDELPKDLLTALLVNRTDAALQIDDDAQIVRELATYLVGGMHTNSLTLVNSVDLLLLAEERDPSILGRVANDPAFAQRCVHEALRLRPNTPKPKRHAEADTMVGGRSIPFDAVVVLDIATANRDQRIFGGTANEFDPDRVVPEGIPRWGLSFGAGPHQCPGRTLAGGFPVAANFTIEEYHLFGVVAIMLREVVRRGVRRDPAREPVADARTERYTWWSSYPVVFDERRAAGLIESVLV